MRFDEGDVPIFTIDVMVGEVSRCRQVIDSSVAGLTHILRWLLGRTGLPSRWDSRIRGPAPKLATCDSSVVLVDFLQEFNGIVLRPRDLDRKLPTSTPALRRQAERYIRGINVAASDTYVHRVTQVIAMGVA